MASSGDLGFPCTASRWDVRQTETSWIFACCVAVARCVLLQLPAAVCSYRYGALPALVTRYLLRYVDYRCCCIVPSYGATRFTLVPLRLPLRLRYVTVQFTLPLFALRYRLRLPLRYVTLRCGAFNVYVAVYGALRYGAVTRYGYRLLIAAALTPRVTLPLLLPFSFYLLLLPFTWLQLPQLPLPLPLVPLPLPLPTVTTTVVLPPPLPLPPPLSSPPPLPLVPRYVTCIGSYRLKVGSVQLVRSILRFKFAFHYSVTCHFQLPTVGLPFQFMIHCFFTPPQLHPLPIALTLPFWFFSPSFQVCFLVLWSAFFLWRQQHIAFAYLFRRKENALLATAFSVPAFIHFLFFFLRSVVHHICIYLPLPFLFFGLIATAGSTSYRCCCSTFYHHVYVLQFCSTFRFHSFSFTTIFFFFSLSHPRSTFLLGLLTFFWFYLPPQLTAIR